MGKRTIEKFERRKNDLYPTPYLPVLRLIPHLKRYGVKTFAEMCCGNGDLIRHLELHGFTCVYRGDIATGQNALEMTFADYHGADCGITNPPHSYGPRSNKLLRDLLGHLLRIKPAVLFWFLLPHDFLDNEHAAPFVKHATDIVAIGRIKWMDGTKTKGKDNNDWVRFELNGSSGPPAFYNDRDAPKDRVLEAFLCLDCKYDTCLDEYYMLHDVLWRSILPKKRGMLCVGCVETRLGRRLRPEDFPLLPINDPTSEEHLKSARLLSRIMGVAENVAQAAEAAE